MYLSINDKKNIVSNFKDKIKDLSCIILVDFKNVSVQDMTELRKKARKNKVYVSVIRNNLLKYIFCNTKFECLNNVLYGQNCVAFSEENIGESVRLFKFFIKQNVPFRIKAGVLEDKLMISNEEINYLSTIPTYLEVIDNLLFVLKEISLGRILKSLHILQSHNIIVNNI